MTLTDLQQRLLSQIEIELQQFFESYDFGKSIELKHMLKYHMGWDNLKQAAGASGKRIRPLLTLLTCGAFTGASSPAMPAAIAIELLHNFTLIHDDIEDLSPLRHGRPTLWKQRGQAQAINAGDALFSLAQLSLFGLTVTCPESTVLTAQKRFNEVCLHLTQGQYLDISFETASEVTLADYETMIEGKTAALIAFAAECGTLIAGEDTDTQHALYEFGKSVGLAFQIQDDALGVWGDPTITGKSAASDLVSKKKTLPILYGLKESPPFRELWAIEQPTRSQVETMADMLEACGAQVYAQTQATDHTQRAYTILESSLPQPNDYAKALFELIQHLLNRQM